MDFLTVIVIKGTLPWKFYWEFMLKGISTRLKGVKTLVDRTLRGIDGF